MTDFAFAFTIMFIQQQSRKCGHRRWKYTIYGNHIEFENEFDEANNAEAIANTTHEHKKKYFLLFKKNPFEIKLKKRNENPNEKE